MIQYKYLDPELAPTLKVPILHRVHFSRYRIAEMREWLETNCRADWYVSPGWTDSFVEFEDDADATAFALRWQ